MTIFHNDRSLYWERLNISEAYGASLAEFVPKLEQLTMYNIRRAEGFNLFFQSLSTQRIRSLKIDSCHELDLRIVLSNCPFLESLECDELGYQPNLFDVISKSLKSLSIGIPNYNKRPVLKKLAEFKCLESLKIEACVIDSDDLNFLRHLNLTSFEITGHTKLLSKISTLYKNLKELVFWPDFSDSNTKRYDERSFYNFARNVQYSIEKLTLRSCDLTDEFFGQLAADGVLFHRLTSVDIDFAARHVSDYAICTFFTKCTNLRKFSMSQTRITDVGLRKLFNNCRKLREIELTFTNTVSTPFAMIAIVDYARKYSNRKIKARIPCDTTFFADNLNKPTNLTMSNSFK